MMFNNNNNITITIKRFEELIKKEERYNYLYSLLYNHFKDVLQEIFDYLDDIDLDKFKELSKNNENEEVKKNENISN